MLWLKKRSTASTGSEWTARRLSCAGHKQKMSERDERSRARAERQEKMQGLNLYIKNLHSDIDNDRLRALFEPFGKVVSCCVMVDGQGSSRGFGFVCFDNDKSVREATEQMNGKLVEKRPLYSVWRSRRRTVAGNCRPSFL